MRNFLHAPFTTTMDASVCVHFSFDMSESIPSYRCILKATLYTIHSVTSQLCCFLSCSLHCHFCIWGSLPPHLLQRVSTCGPFVLLVAEVLESMLSAELPLAVHVEGVLRRHAGHPATHNAMTTGPVYQELTAEELENACATTGLPPDQISKHHRSVYDTSIMCRAYTGADGTNIHEHSDTCRREGTAFCRLGKPSALTECTCVVELHGVPDPTNPKANGEPSERVEPKPGGVTQPPEGSGVARDRRVSPLDLDDARLLVWELLRSRLELDGAAGLDLPPHLLAQLRELSATELAAVTKALAKRNGQVVEFNATMTALLGCNTAAYFLGSLEQARGALW